MVSVGDPFSGRQAAPSYRPSPLGSVELGRGCRWIPPSRYTEPKGTHAVPHDSDISAVIPLASAGAPGSEAHSPSGERGETEAGRAGAGAAPAGEDGGQPPGAGRGSRASCRDGGKAEVGCNGPDSTLSGGPQPCEPGP